MRDLTLFSPFSNKENDISNYCGAMLKTIYRINPQAFNHIMEAITEGNCNAPVFGPVFTQQTRVNKNASKSISDIAITQSCVKVFFETKKHFKGFYLKQINEYLVNIIEDNCCCKNYLILLANFDGNDPWDVPVIKKAISVSKNKFSHIEIIPVDFKQLINAMMEFCGNDFLHNILLDFYEYLDNLGLLPSWKNRLMIINCTGSMSDIENYNSYYCPMDYKHQRAFFFATYQSKNINHIFTIRAVLSVEYDKTSKTLVPGVIHNNVKASNQSLENEAINIVNKCCLTEVRTQHAMKVILLDNRNDISFTKQSSGGMQTSKMYVENMNAKYNSATNIANHLNNKTWRDKNDIESFLK